MSEHQTTYSSTASRVYGVVGVVTAVGVAGAALFATGREPAYAVVAVAVLLGALCWAAMLRPAVIVDDTTMVLRNLLTSVTIPLAAIESVDVRLVLIVRAGARTITSSAVGRTRRQLNRQGRAAGGIGGMGLGVSPQLHETVEESHDLSSYGRLVEEQLKARVELARRDAGIENFSHEQAAIAEQISSRVAVPEVATIVLAAVASIVLLIL